mmetsp:Transcript_52384/g.132403  ORF Transcript_52384/g.132403 Transcript_52384/m.132403 type:complete len:486 (-) Transcript_52384:242-1699(-)
MAPTGPLEERDSQGPAVGDIFKTFLQEPDAPEIAIHFATLLRQVDPPVIAALEPHLAIRSLQLPWKARELWKLLDAKVAGGARKCQAPLRVLIVGAGPVGLRLAIELRAAGHQVVVVDKRERFNRVNRLHLWEWCRRDLVSLGAKIFDPPGRHFCADGDFCHIGISELQSMLFKFALLLGVSFTLGADYLGPCFCEASDGHPAVWCANLHNADGDEVQIPFDVLAGADGANSAVARTPAVAEELGRIKFGLRQNSAIGLVANFVGNVPHGLRQFSWARQFAQEKFARLEQETGVSLENCVYYRSGTQHYLVMTPSPSSLVSQGVFLNPEASELTAPANVHRCRLREIAAAVAMFFGLPPMDFAEAPNDAMIFDFSGSARAQGSCSFLRTPPGTEGGQSAMVALVGDALLEPFWPEGLGILRGFHSALDTAAAIGAWGGTDEEAALRVAAMTFAVLKSLCAQSAWRLLQPDTAKYDVDPQTRYKGF